MRYIILVIITPVIFLSFLQDSLAQTDTVRITTYNILNFPGAGGEERLDDLETAVSSMTPDIFVCQEMQSSAGTEQFQEGVFDETYDHALFVNGPDTDNMLYFHDEILDLVSQDRVRTSLRDINIYRLHFTGQDADLFIASAHLKASQGGENEQRRLGEVQDFLDYYQDHLQDEFVLFCGDFNIYNSGEPAYQELMDNGFNDPIERPGNWHNSSQFSLVHTQSPRVEAFGGGATGGLDDRFDFILVNDRFLQDDSWSFLDDTYQTFGNDGNHFNRAVNDGQNGVVSGEVADALHAASDHLPVMMDFVVRTENTPALVIPIADNYFELISFPLNLLDPSTEAVFNGLESLQIVYQDDGHLYVPWLLDTINEVQTSEGYSLFCLEADSLPLYGNPIEEDVEYELQAGPWNWLGYPYMEPMNVAAALRGIEPDVAVMMSDDGRYWIPDLGINTLELLQPGEGYYIMVDDDLLFVYPPNNQPGMLKADSPTGSMTDQTVIPTGRPYPIILDIENGSEREVASIEVYDHDVLAGSANCNPETSYQVVTAWEGIPEYGLPGFSKDHLMTIHLKDAYGSEIPFLSEPETARFGSEPYQLFAITTESMILPGTPVITSVYPNPFNSRMRVRIDLPGSGQLKLSLYNLAGQKVYSVVSGFAAGSQREFNIDGANLASGIYLLGGDFNGSLIPPAKVILLK